VCGEDAKHHAGESLSGDDKRDKHSVENGVQIADAITKIHGPSAEELRRPYSRSLNEIAREWQQGHADAVRKFSNGEKQ